MKDSGKVFHEFIAPTVKLLFVSDNHSDILSGQFQTVCSGCGVFLSFRVEVTTVILICRIILSPRGFLSKIVPAQALPFPFPLPSIAWVRSFFPFLLGRCKQKQRGLRGLLCRWPSIAEWEMHITAQPPVSKMTYTMSSGTLNSTIPYHTIPYHPCPFLSSPFLPAFSFPTFPYHRILLRGQNEYCHLYQQGLGALIGRICIEVLLGNYSLTHWGRAPTELETCIKNVKHSIRSERFIVR